MGGDRESQKLNIERREFVVECQEPVKARIETYNYPHWVVRLDGREIKIEVESGTGLMLDQNEHSSYFPNQ